jgi:proteasome lid subunit RPN8/RPN11
MNPSMSYSTDAPPSTLKVPRRLRERLERWVGQRYPSEACGLLIGRRERGRTVVVDVAEVRNLDTANAGARYEMDPAGQLAAAEAARSRGLDVVGIWHSHPDHPARPSESDRIRAWPGWSYAIISVNARGASQLRAWRLEQQRFVEEEVLP